MKSPVDGMELKLSPSLGHLITSPSKPFKWELWPTGGGGTVFMWPFHKMLRIMNYSHVH